MPWSPISYGARARLQCHQWRDGCGQVDPHRCSQSCARRTRRSYAIRAEVDHRTVEATFDIAQLDVPLPGFLEEHGLNPGGKPIVPQTHVHDRRQQSPVRQCALITLQPKRIGEWLVDMHGPHDHQSLLHPARQLVILDALADCSNRAPPSPPCSSAASRLSRPRPISWSMRPPRATARSAAVSGQGNHRCRVGPRRRGKSRSRLPTLQ